jgi:hypothetical protein
MLETRRASHVAASFHARSTGQPTALTVYIPLSSPVPIFCHGVLPTSRPKILRELQARSTIHPYLHGAKFVLDHRLAQSDAGLALDFLRALKGIGTYARSLG